MIDFWTKSLIFSPALVRMMARKKGGKPMSALDVADASIGLTPAQVEAISQSTSWEHIDLPTMREYLTACSLDFCDAAQCRRAILYLKSKPNFEYLRVSPEWKTYWLPLMIRWRKSCGVVTKELDIYPPLRALLLRTFYKE